MSIHIPFDIQLQIIKMFPVRSLFRFRSVCKEWKSLIDSSEFIAGYDDHDPPHNLVVRYEVRRNEEEENEVKYVLIVDDDDDNDNDDNDNEDNDNDDDDDSFPPKKFDLIVHPLVEAATTIIGVSHGLLCLISSDDFPKTAVIWNPSIRKSVVVTMPNVIERPFGSVIGFGVCSDTKDPMLVHITYIHDCTKINRISCIPFQVMVFTLSSGEWRTPSCSNLPRKTIGFTCLEAVIGPFIYWLAYEYNVEDSFGFHNLIMSFDIRTEEFRETDLPDSFTKLLEPDLALYTLRESLVVVGYRRSLWMLMDHGDSKVFTKLFTVKQPNALVLRSSIGFWKSGEPIVEVCDDYITPTGLAVCGPRSKHIKDLGICGDRGSFFGGSYTESLFLLDQEDGRII